METPTLWVRGFIGALGFRERLPGSCCSSKPHEVGFLSFQVEWKSSGSRAEGLGGLGLTGLRGSGGLGFTGLRV